ncbi:SGNH/GDSL hydrolase family protein [Pseudalkalibacillus caeni]|uniref:SGNH/GDSL hydrolase family protein n=1 Tax=Exobacillus caeni TaxID=2574798 RepID=A0A5R9F832_9BACL|nr:SGNH/GDSL hydrolase family protein [Pseudalkalibacillus caeni]TLS38486.1 SGNH/GDSL hydrolase family protein [Pseudalkalibacillus caeni]
MKNLFIVFLCCISILILFLGEKHYNNKLDEKGKAAHAILSNPTMGKETSQSNKENKKAIEQLSEHLPASLSGKIMEAVEAKNEVNIVVVGSSALSDESSNWSSVFQQRLNAAYGPDIFKIKRVSFGNATSDKIVRENLYINIPYSDADILIIEPFVLNDNKLIPIKSSHQNLTFLLNYLLDKKEDLEIVIQPSNPIYEGGYYQGNTNELKKYALENNFTYLDYWEVWPDSDSNEVKRYLDENNKPNAEGNELWGNYIADFFIGF